jgi:hypothetical protein
MIFPFKRKQASRQAGAQAHDKPLQAKYYSPNQKYINLLSPNKNGEM